MLAHLDAVLDDGGYQGGDGEEVSEISAIEFLSVCCCLAEMTGFAVLHQEGQYDDAPDGDDDVEGGGEGLGGAVEGHDTAE